MELVKSPNSASVYLLRGGTKIPIGGPWVFDQMGWNFGMVKTIDQGTLDRYATGPTANSAAELRGQPSQPSNPAAAITQPIINDLQQRANQLLDFIRKQKATPLAFDEEQARRMGQEQFRPYYDRVLNDFVKPLNERISRSKEDLTRALEELTRSTNLGEKQLNRAEDLAVENIAGSAAERGLYGSGGALRAEGLQRIKSNEALSDYLAKSAYQQKSLQTEAERTQSDTQFAIDTKRRDIFGTPGTGDTGLFGESVQGYIQNKKTEAEKARNLRILQEGANTYGADAFSSIPDYLKLA